MIKILPKYIIKEHAVPFFFALLAINLTFILNIVFRDLGKFLSKGLSIPVIFEFLFLNMAWIIALSVPMAVLTATLMAFGRLTDDNEMTAIRASGVSFFQILPPVLVIATLVAFGLIWFNNNVLPDFNHRTRLLAMDINRKKPTINLDSGVFYTDIPNYSILVQNIKVRGSISDVENITIYDQTESNTIKTIIAETGQIQMNEGTGFLEFKLFNGEMQEVNITSMQSFKRLLFPKHLVKIPIDQMILKRSQSGFRGDREKSASALLADVAKNNSNIRGRKKDINVKVKQHLKKYLNPQVGEMTLKSIIEDHRRFTRQLKGETKMITSFTRQNKIYLVEVHKKYSIPAACLVFVLIGAPLGVISRKGGMLLAAGMSLGFFLLYWVCLIGGESLADREVITPAAAMWSPNIIVGSAGLFLVYRLLKK